MNAALRAAALLAAVLALSACATLADRRAEEKAIRDKEKAEKAAEDDVNPKGKAALYRRIKQLTEAWMQAYAGGGAASADEAEALGTAVAREVWDRFDEVVEDLATSDNPRWRIAAARGLGFIQHARVRPALEAALEDADASVLAAALVSLSRGAAAETDDGKVARLLSFPDRIVAGDAALCLAKVFQTRRQQKLPVLDPARVPNVESDLQVLLFDPTDPILRGTAAQALGELGTPVVEDALLNRVRDENPFVRIKVAQALAQCGTAKGYDILLDSLGREQSKNVQTVTALAIGSIAERQGLTPAYPELKTDAAAWRKWLKK
jgi:hypothetical protein